MYNIGDIVTVHNSIDADDVKYLNHTGIIQEIHKKDEKEPFLSHTPTIPV